ncbi:MAG: winged helix-turn-helix transcriptional regulator [Candidatus Aenigmarchaeota archaeon]|nr:winged helix-turn-helix transcriptional regulator [Candidatus Aenigmarchaeota archaeon]
MDEKITLDRKAFRALSSATRIEILKKLGSRRMTLTELSNALGMTPSTVKEHLDALCSSELIEQKDEGRKWKYYALTKKGRNITSPAEKRVFIILGISAIAFIAGLVGFFRRTAPLMLRAESTVKGAESAVQGATPTPYIELLVIIIACLAMGFCIWYILAKKRL